MWGQPMTWKQWRTCAIMGYIGTLVSGLMTLSFVGDNLYYDEGVAIISGVFTGIFLIEAIVCSLVACKKCSEEEDNYINIILPEKSPLFIHSENDEDELDFLTCGDDNLYERFLKLKKLYEDELITEEEYEWKKKELLEEL